MTTLSLTYDLTPHKGILAQLTRAKYLRLREQVLQRREETLWQRFELLVTAAEGPSPNPSASLVPGLLDHSNVSSINHNLSMTTMSMPVSPIRNSTVTIVTGDQYGSV